MSSNVITFINETLILTSIILHCEFLFLLVGTEKSFILPGATLFNNNKKK
jgi:hypothetical protein